LSISDIADQLDVHANTVRFHLATLVENGQVEQVEADRRPERPTGRPPLRFRPVLGMDPTGPRQFQLLAELLGDGLANAPGGSARAVEAGRAWGRRRAATSSEGETATAGGSGDSVPRLIGLLAEIGFAPEQQGDGAQRRIGLRHCPFLELAQTRSAIVCPVHLGLMQGAMEAWRSPVAVDRLEPFVEPDLCLAHLTTEGAS
jgi:predicted ArsR family transcriptional regulator